MTIPRMGNCPKNLHLIYLALINKQITNQNGYNVTLETGQTPKWPMPKLIFLQCFVRAHELCFLAGGGRRRGATP